jgi:hypothetical protein
MVHNTNQFMQLGKSGTHETRTHIRSHRNCKLLLEAHRNASNAIAGDPQKSRPEQDHEDANRSP